MADERGIRNGGEGGSTARIPRGYRERKPRRYRASKFLGGDLPPSGRGSGSPRASRVAATTRQTTRDDRETTGSIARDTAKMVEMKSRGPYRRYRCLAAKEKGNYLAVREGGAMVGSINPVAFDVKYGF